MNRQLLEKPFEPAQIRQRKGRNGLLDYVEGHSVIQRLNEALEGAWSFEIVQHEIREDEVLVLAKLTAEGITKMNFGVSQVTRERESGALVSLGDDLKAAALPELDEGVRNQVLEDMPPEQVAKALQQLDSDEAVYVIEDLDKDEQSDILAKLPHFERIALERSLEVAGAHAAHAEGVQLGQRRKPRHDQQVQRHPGPGFADLLSQRLIPDITEAQQIGARRVGHAALQISDELVVRCRHGPVELRGEEQQADARQRRDADDRRLGQGLQAGEDRLRPGAPDRRPRGGLRRGASAA